jgi:MFS family permease
MRQAAQDRLQRLMIYGLPVLTDIVLGLVVFVNPVRAAKFGASATTVAAIVAVWSAVYIVGCPLAGRFVTVRNAARLMLAGIAMQAVLCLLFVMAPSLSAMFILVACVGVANSLFFPAFQVFMTAVDRLGGKSPAYSAGLYTCAWSVGVAVGPLVGGVLMGLDHEQGWKYGYYFCGAVSVLTLVGIIWLQHLAHAAHPSGSTGPGVDPVPMPARQPDLAWLGWAVAAAGLMALYTVKGVFPRRAVDIAMADSTLGLLFFLLSLAQGLSALFYVRHWRWVYQERPAVAFAVLGIVCSLVFGFAASPVALLAGSVGFGIFSGFFFFQLVHHSIVHPVRRARYIAVNEMVVALGGIVGPLVGGLLSDHWGFAVPYCLWAILIAAMVVVQVAVHRRVSAPYLAALIPERK